MTRQRRERQRGAGRGVFGIEDLTLDLPAVVGAFSQRLHDAGMPVTPSQTQQYAHSLALTKPESRRRLYWATRAIFVTGLHPGADVRPRLSRGLRKRREERRRRGSRGRARACAAEGRDRERRGARRRRGPPGFRRGRRRHVAGRGERRRRRRRRRAGDPDPLGQRGGGAVGEALLRAGGARARGAVPADGAPRPRHAACAARGASSAAATASTWTCAARCATACKTGGDPIKLARRRRRVHKRRLVLLCDISGSMEPYARAYLQFLHCARASGPDAEAFVFATRLTRLTKQLAGRNPQRAIRRATEAAPDWSSGTRIGDALKEFNDRHGRRGMARGAVIVILSDGWERGDPEVVGKRDGAPRAPRLPHRVGQPARERARAFSRRPAASSRRCRSATRSSAGTASTRSTRSPTRSPPTTTTSAGAELEAAVARRRARRSRALGRGRLRLGRHRDAQRLTESRRRAGRRPAAAGRTSTTRATRRIADVPRRSRTSPGSRSRRRSRWPRRSSARRASRSWRRCAATAAGRGGARKPKPRLTLERSSAADEHAR